MTDLLKRLEEMAAEIEDFSRQYTKEDAEKIAADLREACRIIKEQEQLLKEAGDAFSGLWGELMDPDVVIARAAASDEPLQAAVEVMRKLGLVKTVNLDDIAALFEPDLPGDES